MKKLAIFGNTVKHSKSHIIHHFFAKQSEIKISYKRIKTHKNTFKKNFKDFLNQGGIGANITSPLKEIAYQKVNKLTKKARICHSINTIKKINNKTILGDNTDGIGLIIDLNRLNFIKNGMNILIIGAGGAVKGILPFLLNYNCKITILNRTFKKAKKIKEHFSHIKKIKIINIKKEKTEEYNLIINATYLGLIDKKSKEFLKKIIKKNVLCYDLSYLKNKTQFLYFVKEQGVLKFANGLGMLIIQAAFSFKLWFGILPNIYFALSKIKF